MNLCSNVCTKIIINISCCKFDFTGKIFKFSNLVVRNSYEKLPVPCWLADGDLALRICARSKWRRRSKEVVKIENEIKVCS